MNNKNELTDKLILFFACTCIYLIQPFLDVDVVPIIIAVIISCLLSYLDSDKLKISLYVVYFVSCLILPSMIVFMPLFLYDLFQQRYQILILVFILPLIIFLDTNGLVLSGTVFAFITIGLWLKYRSAALLKMKRQYYHLSDNARDLSNQLKTQNKELYEKIDNDIYLATLRERNRIAREIHDNVGHQLSSAILQIGALLAVTKSEALREPLIVVNNTLSQAMSSIRTSVHDLHDQSVDLHMQMEALFANFSFCRVIFEDQLITQPEKRLKLAFIAITKEALSNIVKHTNATLVDIHLREHPAFYQLIIRDNGTEKITPADNGIGLMNMSDRVNALNGNMNIKRENGFEIFISVPKEEIN